MAWATLASGAFDDEWLVVIEDDALPCNDFRAQLADALDHCPTDIAGLYLGRSRPPQWQDFIQQAVWRADDENACRITRTPCSTPLASRCVGRNWSSPCSIGHRR